MRSGHRVAFLASEYPPYVYGGLGTHVHALTSALVKRDVELDLFVPYRQGRYESPPLGVELHEIPVDNPRSDTEFWLRFCSCAIAPAQQLGKSITLIHCHDWMTTLAGIRLRKILNVPLVFKGLTKTKSSHYGILREEKLLWRDEHGTDGGSQNVAVEDSQGP